MNKELLQQALNALENAIDYTDTPAWSLLVTLECNTAIDALGATVVRAAATCQHSIADARNPVVKSGYFCIKCGALFSAADHEPPKELK